MTQKEFEERTELKLTADNYTEVETCYMNTDLDKDAFCKLWMKNPAALKEIEQKTVLVRELYEERKCLANFLIEQAEKWSASDLREKAIAMIGEKEYIRKSWDGVDMAIRNMSVRYIDILSFRVTGNGALHL